ncbi:Pet127-domain-containing protein [Aspergillus ellipticus CBS 707.79]|uniref:Pet127-domain-containing protein n=1 Tax=Aspergillus ellipticus CBS 707.79 TaxID=1448320 RepID=A0A319DMQ5_9EURO|nr:Pet127-domain-containing protein [Aspergillus ellipticus CBS 707.79]
MLRASLRSVSGPPRDHVCLSCLARARRFHAASPWLKASPAPRSLDDLVNSIHKKFASRDPEPQRENDDTETTERRTRRPRDLRKRLSTPPPPKTQPQKDKSSHPQLGRIGAIAPNAPTFPRGALSGKDSGKVSADGHSIEPLDVPTPEVPRLAYGLDRVLFNPGVYQLRDPRSRVFNFDPYLGSIMPVTEFDFDSLKEYITSSRDEQLRGLAMQEKKKYIGSSSSMTSVLSHFHYLLSQWRPVNTTNISRGFPDDLRTFTRLLRTPSAMFLRYQDGVYAIDADKEFDTANILMNLGKSMEKLLTMPKDEFERYRRSSKNKITAEEERAIPESYHYSTYGDFLMRSQLDAYDPRLPGTGMFDLKTRAVASIRMDARNFEHGLGYEIRSIHGEFESYEREYYDMIRAALLKYSLQVRIGRMDGIFVAFHNIQRIFGFQYINLAELDLALHGQNDTALGDREFLLSLQLWNKVLDKVTARFPKQSIRLHFETRDSTGSPFMYIFAEPVTEEEAYAIQNKNKDMIDAYQRRILNLAPPPIENNNDNNNTTTTTTTDAATPDATTTPDATDANPTNSPDAAAAAADAPPPKDIFGMVLTIKNTVNGEPVTRPEEDFTKDESWVINYELHNLTPSQAHSKYQACQRRREQSLAERSEDAAAVTNNDYIRMLRNIAKKGRRYRQEQDLLDRAEEIIVLNNEQS